MWLHHAGRLLKAAPEQLRGASSREAVEELQGPAVPWTISSLATHPRKTFHDIPRDAQWQMDLPSSGKGPWKIHGVSKGLVSQLKRSGVEVWERTDDELLQFKSAEAREVNSYIQSHCFKVLPEDIQAKQDAVGMRWVLTWKISPEDPQTRKAKAR